MDANLQQKKGNEPRGEGRERNKLNPDTEVNRVLKTFVETTDLYPCLQNWIHKNGLVLCVALERKEDIRTVLQVAKLGRTEEEQFMQVWEDLKCLVAAGAAQDGPTTEERVAAWSKRDTFAVREVLGQNARVYHSDRVIAVAWMLSQLQETASMVHPSIFRNAPSPSDRTLKDWKVALSNIPTTPTYEGLTPAQCMIATQPNWEEIWTHTQTDMSRSMQRRLRNSKVNYTSLGTTLLHEAVFGS